MKKKIIVTGATGLIGNKLCTELIHQGNEVTIFSRNSSSAKMLIPDAAGYVDWDYNKPELWQKYIDGSDVVIHLAGASVAGKRWNDEYKKIIRESRIISTKNLANVIIQCENKPRVLITSSASGYYGNRGDAFLNEESGHGSDFLARVCKSWEDEARLVEKYNVRRVSFRTGIVLSPDAGALKKMILPFRLFIGGPLGNGRQWFPWIHIDDIVKLYINAVDNDSLHGAVNASSPQHNTMSEFAKTLGKVLKRPSLLPVPELVLKLVAGKVASDILASQKLDVSKVLNAGFRFQFANLEDALRDLL